MEDQVRAFLNSSDFQLTYSPSTRLAYDNDLRRFMEYLQDTLDRPPVLEDFTAVSVAGFLDTERRAGRRLSTLLRRRASIRRFADFLRSNCPEWQIEFEPHEHLIDQALVSADPSEKPRFLDGNQIESLWTILENTSHPRAFRDQAIMALLLESGLSVGGLLTLDLDDVQIEDSSVRVRVQREPDVWLRLESAAKTLKVYLSDGRPELNYHPDEPALFISQTGGRMSRQGVWQVLRQWGKKAKLPFTLSPRLVRHTAVVRLVEDGQSVERIQALLGHSNPLSTQALLRRLVRGEDGGLEDIEE